MSLGGGGLFFRIGVGGNCRLTLCTIFCACHRQLCMLAGCFKLRSSVHFTCICRKSALALINNISSFEDSEAKRHKREIIKAMKTSFGDFD